MERLNEELVESIDAYIESLFVPDDSVLTESLNAAAAAGLPPINVSPNQGKLLYLIAKIGRAARILEIGTLGGYSAIWLARALSDDGRLISLERDPAHAKVARENLARAGFRERTEVRVGAAADLLLEMIAAGEPPFDLIFIDANKPGYVQYLDLSLRLSRPGTVILADNVIRHGGVMQNQPPDENAVAAKSFNATLAGHPGLESLIVPIIRKRIDGLSVSIVKPV